MSEPTLITIPKRPGRRSPEVVAAVAQALLPAVLQHLGEHDEGGDEGGALSDLTEVLEGNYEWDGYTLAKSLDDDCYWEASSSLVEILDEAERHRHRAEGVVVAAWVKAYKIEPKLRVGDAVEFRGGRGKIAAVNYGTAEYTVQEDGGRYALPTPDFVCGHLVAFEDVKAIEESK